MIEKKSGIGKRIREVRNKLGLSQTEFADLVKSTQSSISGYELEDVPVPADILLNIVKECDVSADWLLLGIEPDVPKNQKERLMLTTFRQAELYNLTEELLKYSKWRVSEGKLMYEGKKEAEKEDTKSTSVSEAQEGIQKPA
jgi:transcriptional regulator with XRE-family HTH domain